jgi:hypothetical protein
MAPIEPDDWLLVPDRFRGELIDYFLTGRAPEHPALVAVLSNDLVESLVRVTSLVELTRLALFLTDRFPSIAWGSGERIARWEAAGGFTGRKAAA